MYIHSIKHKYSIIINKSRKSLLINMGDAKVHAVFWSKCPLEKAEEAKVRVRVRALTLMSKHGFPEVK